MTPKPSVPTSLNIDADWAAAIRWLQAHGLRLHVPLRGEVQFKTTKAQQ